MCFYKKIVKTTFLFKRVKSNNWSNGVIIVGYIHIKKNLLFDAK